MFKQFKQKIYQKINIDTKIKKKYNGGNKMKLFTYQDYLIYEELHGTILKIAESAENYDYGQ